MTFDALTISAIIISLIVVIVVIAAIRRGDKRNEHLIREVARQTSMVAEHDTARKLCRFIQEKHPDACPGMDFTIRCEGGKAYVDCWYLDSPRPSEAEVEQAVSRADNQS